MIFDISRVIYIYNIIFIIFHFYSNILTLNLKKKKVNVVLPIKKVIIFFLRKKKMTVHILTFPSVSIPHCVGTPTQSYKKAERSVNSPFFSF